MYLIMILVLFVVIANILWPLIINKSIYEKKVMDYIISNNFTSPYCYSGYMGIVERNIFGLQLKLGIDSNGSFTNCSTIPSSYYQCGSKDYINRLHPCTIVNSSFRVFTF